MRDEIIPHAEARAMTVNHGTPLPPPYTITFPVQQQSDSTFCQTPHPHLAPSADCLISSLFFDRKLCPTALDANLEVEGYGVESCSNCNLLLPLLSVMQVDSVSSTSDERKLEVLRKISLHTLKTPLQLKISPEKNLYIIRPQMLGIN